MTGIALLAVFLGGCDFVDQLKNPERYAAKVRLQAILTAVQAGNHMSQQDIICLFYLSSRNQCDMKDLDRGTRTFEQWLHKKNIQRGIDSFEIVDFWEDPTQKNLAYFFHVKINGKNAYIRVEHRVPLKWAKKMEKPTESG